MIITIDGNIPSKFAHSFNVMKMAQGFFDIGEKVTLVSALTIPNLINKLKINNIYKYYGISNKIKIKYVSVFNIDFFYKTIGIKNYNIKAANIIKKMVPNFVYCRSYLTVYHCVKLGIPTIMETHTTAYELPDLKKIYEIAEDNNFLGLVTIHENIKNEHFKRGVPEEKILVLEDGVDLRLFEEISDDKIYWRKELKLPVDKKLILYCGSLYKEKGIEDILKTAKKMSKMNNILFILIGGREEEIRNWKNFVKKNEIKNILFMGFVNNIDVPKYLKSADALIMPYNIDTKYNVMDINTTSPIKLFEYMASKRPIVTTNIPVISKIVTHNENAMLASANNINELSKFIYVLINDKKKSKMIADNAYEIVKKHEWKFRCERIVNKFIN